MTPGRREAAHGVRAVHVVTVWPAWSVTVAFAAIVPRAAPRVSRPASLTTTWPVPSAA